MNTFGRKAVVIGASIAGLTAARALAPHFETVLVVERDEQPNTSLPRKAVPQGHHVHALLKSGELALEQLFPNIIQELIDQGAKRVDFSKDLRWYHGGHWKMRYPSDFHIMIQTRPLLEQVIRQRVATIPNVGFYNGYVFESIKTDDAKTKIIAVGIQESGNRGRRLELESDLLVDTSGRGSKTPRWLVSLGYTPPTESYVKIDLTYSSRLYAAPADKTFDWKLLVINPHHPESLRAGYIFPVENNRWLITFAGYSGDATPQTNEQFMDYAKGLARPDIYELMQNLTPVTDVKSFGVPQMLRRHYENTRLPEGLLIMGDAFCAFDPVYGQGMSVAAQEAVVLSELLSTTPTLADVTKRFHKKAAKIVEAPWLLTRLEDFRYPKTVGQKPPLTTLLHWYSSHVYALTASDQTVYEAFRQVMHLLEGAPALFSPRVAFKVFKHALSRKRRPTTDSVLPLTQQVAEM